MYEFTKKIQATRFSLNIKYFPCYEVNAFIMDLKQIEELR